MTALHQDRAFEDVMPDASPGWEWYRELADMPWQPPQAPWPGEPARCTCTQQAAATLTQTLACPMDWRHIPGAGWIHPHPARQP